MTSNTLKNKKRPDNIRGTMNPEKREKTKSTAGKMAAVAHRWVKQLFNAMMEASARYHEAQTERAAAEVAGEGKKNTARKAAQRQKQSEFDKRAL